MSSTIVMKPLRPHGPGVIGEGRPGPQEDLVPRPYGVLLAPLQLLRQSVKKRDDLHVVKQFLDTTMHKSVQTTVHEDPRLPGVVYVVSFQLSVPELKYYEHILQEYGGMAGEVNDMLMRELLPEYRASIGVGIQQDPDCVTPSLLEVLNHEITINGLDFIEPRRNSFP
ncbi:hypothetical protein EJ04DRAFT_518646 [Polyplosphaeria fusca]|uniref:Uncharacterized protein n=1 Tax=Polyplosphaeria fusca TaxID=682080 RepID=A0A9P4RB94_9PLEO|nr:hypothetical protein EJ04DRAFT_518646 [Polyplosphaeria fusca]